MLVDLKLYTLRHRYFTVMQWLSTVIHRFINILITQPIVEGFVDMFAYYRQWATKKRGGCF